MTHIVKTHDVRLDVVDKVGDFQHEVLQWNDEGRQIFVVILTDFFQGFMNPFASFNNLQKLDKKFYSIIYCL